MGLPGHRRTSSHKRRRAAHFALTKLALSACPKCQKPIAPHRACKNCGTYRGRTVIDTGRSAERLLKKAKALAPAAKASGKTKAKADAHDHEGHDHADHDHKESPKA